MYLENKSETGDRGEARIGWATFSKSGRSVYYRGRRFQRLRGGGIRGNYFDVDTGDEYWISGIKKTGSNRHRTGGGDIVVDEDAQSEYEKIVTG